MAKANSLYGKIGIPIPSAARSLSRIAIKARPILVRIRLTAINAMKNTVRKADVDTPPAKVSKEQGEKIEARLESLARMYEMKKTKKSKEGEDTEDTDQEDI